MKSIRVLLKSKTSDDRSYNISFGPVHSLFPRALKSLELDLSKVFLVSSRKLVRLGHAKRIHQALAKSGFQTQALIIPDGEEYKSLETLTHLYEEALEHGIDRRSVVVSVGGGVVSDLAGFFAGTILRGIPFISVPTTLLGMVDASIGGKTGVDLPQGKNLVGVFWQPRLVWIDTALLRTLPRREWITGFAEIIKYGVIRDASFFRWLVDKTRKQPDILRWSEKDIQFAVWNSARNKAAVVSQDEKETPLKGRREILNFGHTIGHALEAATGYKVLSHGEAVSIGMSAAGLLSRELNLWSDDAQLQLLSTLQVVGLPIHIPARVKVDWVKFWSALRRDKKIIGGHLRFVLPRKIGSVIVKSGISIKLVKETMASLGYV